VDIEKPYLKTECGDIKIQASWVLRISCAILYLDIKNNMHGSRSSYLKPNFIVEAGMPIYLHFLQSNTVMRPEMI
jgi:hypothetical protein